MNWCLPNIVRGAALLAAGLALACGSGCDRPSPATLEPARAVSSFALEDSFGRPITDRDLTGRVSVVAFFLSSCAPSSGPICDRMAEVQRQTRDQPGVQLLSFTVDPLGDKPETLRALGQRLGAETNRWRFVTGRRSHIHSLIRSSFVSADAQHQYQQTGANPILEQCERIVVVDPAGWVRANFDATREDVATRILEAIHRLRQEHKADSQLRESAK